MTTRTSSLGSDPLENLQQALRTLRGIRHRYETERTAHPDVGSYNVHVALGGSDMIWIAAAIEALEEPTLAGATEAAEAVAAARVRPRGTNPD